MSSRTLRSGESLRVTPWKINISSKIGTISKGNFILQPLLGGGFKDFLFLPLFGEDSHFDEKTFQMG